MLSGEEQDISEKILEMLKMKIGHLKVLPNIPSAIGFITRAKQQKPNNPVAISVRSFEFGCIKLQLMGHFKHGRES